MSAYQNLLEVIQSNIFESRGYKNDTYFDNALRQQTNNRVRLLFCLNVIIFQEKKSINDCLLPMKGLDVIHHMLMKKFRWPVSVIKEMSFPELLFALADELRVTNLPEDAQKAISQIPYGGVVFQDYMSKEWELESAQMILAAHDQYAQQSRP